jgi:hypothetical protein
MSLAKATKLAGRNPWRVTDEYGVPLLTSAGKYLDRGGYVRASSAVEQVEAINAARGRQAQRAPTRRQRRKPRRLEIARLRALKVAQAVTEPPRLLLPGTPPTTILPQPFPSAQTG